MFRLLRLFLLSNIFATGAVGADLRGCLVAVFGGPPRSCLADQGTQRHQSTGVQERTECSPTQRLIDPRQSSQVSTSGGDTGNSASAGTSRAGTKNSGSTAAETTSSQSVNLLQSVSSMGGTMSNGFNPFRPQPYELPWEWSVAAYQWRRAGMNQKGRCMKTFTEDDTKDAKTQEQHDLWRSIVLGRKWAIQPALRIHT